MANEKPDTPSSAYERMLPTWQMISDILAGPKQIRKQAEDYLPKYEAEGDTEYARRLLSAPWRPEFDDSLRSLASKPFGQDVGLLEGSSASMTALAEDIDGRGHNLAAFLRPVFRGAIAKGMHAILVDYPTIAPGSTLAEERSRGVRPYWVSIPAEEILALYTDFVDGHEIVTHVRISEKVTVRDGFDEKEIKRVRVLEPGRWEIWVQDNKSGWAKESEGVMTLPQVPLVVLYTGERSGPQEVKPPLADLADMQIELYRKLSRQDEIETYAGSPMLQGQGIAAPDQSEPAFEVGPKRILLAPPGIDGGQTGWSYVQPDAANLKEVRESVRDLIKDMRRLGMQPLLRESGTVTATETNKEAAKAHSAVESWALAMKDVIEQAFVYTAQWMNEKATVEVEVGTDFAVDPFAEAPLTALKDARASGDLSRKSYLTGLRRFSVLPADFDVDAEVKAVEDEAPDFSQDEELKRLLAEDETNEAA